MSRVLVTGADGFIGSHLVEALVREGHDVRAVVLYNSFGSWGWLDECAPDVRGRFEVVSGDVRDPQGMRAATRGVDAVLHLAALIGIPYSYESPDSYVDTNVRGTLNVLQAARDADVARVVVTSTSEVYGTAQFVPITEEHPLQAQSPYAATKIAADQLALSFHRSFDTPVVVLRPFNTYGPRQSTRAVIPTVITQLAAGTRQVALGSVHPTRDFSLVTDIAAGFISALGSPRAVGQVLNLGSGFEISVADTVSLIADVMGVDVVVATDPARVRPADSEVDRLWADTSHARTLLGWQPTHGGLDGFRAGLIETVAWFTNADNQRRYRPGHYTV